MFKKRTSKLGSVSRMMSFFSPHLFCTAHRPAQRQDRVRLRSIAHVPHSVRAVQERPPCHDRAPWRAVHQSTSHPCACEQEQQRRHDSNQRSRRRDPDAGAKEDLPVLVHDGAQPGAEQQHGRPPGRQHAGTAISPVGRIRVRQPRYVSLFLRRKQFFCVRFVYQPNPWFFVVISYVPARARATSGRNPKISRPSSNLFYYKYSLKPSPKFEPFCKKIGPVLSVSISFSFSYMHY